MIFAEVQRKTGHACFWGIKGCGKSTKLNRMSGKLAAAGYYVKTVNCSIDLDLFNIIYSDLFILMGEALLEIAEEAGCEIENNFLGDIKNFWYEGTETVVSQELETASLEAGIVLCY